MRLFGKHSQGVDAEKAAKREGAETDIEKGNVELVESVNEELDDDTESEQVYTCSDCGVTLPLKEMKKNLYVCPKCGKEFLATFIIEENGETMCVDCANI